MLINKWSLTIPYTQALLHSLYRSHFLVRCDGTSNGGNDGTSNDGGAKQACRWLYIWWNVKEVRGFPCTFFTTILVLISMPTHNTGNGVRTSVVWMDGWIHVHELHVEDDIVWHVHHTFDRIVCYSQRLDIVHHNSSYMLM